jgi:hypothetical protein
MRPSGIGLTVGYNSKRASSSPQAAPALAPTRKLAAPSSGYSSSTRAKGSQVPSSSAKKGAQDNKLRASSYAASSSGDSSSTRAKGSTQSVKGPAMWHDGWKRFSKELYTDPRKAYEDAVIDRQKFGLECDPPASSSSSYYSGKYPYVSHVNRVSQVPAVYQIEHCTRTPSDLDSDSD